MRLLLLLLICGLPFYSLAQSKAELKRQINKLEYEVKSWKEEYEGQKQENAKQSQKIEKLEKAINQYKGLEINNYSRPDSNQTVSQDTYRRLNEAYQKKENELENSKTRERNLRNENSVLSANANKWKIKFDSLLLEQKQIYSAFKAFTQNTVTENNNQTSSDDIFAITDTASIQKDSTQIIDYQFYYDSLLVSIFQLSDKYTEKPKPKTRPKPQERQPYKTVSPKVLKLREEIKAVEQSIATITSQYLSLEKLIENYFKAEAQLVYLHQNKYTINTTRYNLDNQGVAFRVNSTSATEQGDYKKIVSCFIKGLKRYAKTSGIALNDQKDLKIVAVLEGNTKLYKQVQLELVSSEVPIQLEHRKSSSTSSIYLELKSATIFKDEFKQYTQKKASYELKIRKKEEKIKELENK